MSQRFTFLLKRGAFVEREKRDAGNNFISLLPWGKVAEHKAAKTRWKHTNTIPRNVAVIMRTAFLSRWEIWITLRTHCMLICIYTPPKFKFKWTVDISVMLSYSCVLANWRCFSTGHNNLWFKVFKITGIYSEASYKMLKQFSGFYWILHKARKRSLSQNQILHQRQILGGGGLRWPVAF